MYFCSTRAFNEQGALLEAAFLVVAISLAITVPSSPGFVGVFQLVGQQALALPFGAKGDVASALAITLAAHLTYYVLTTILGVLATWRVGGSRATYLSLVGRGVAKATPLIIDGHY
jgi:uncharacterized membrane protein YbhN (UPF0104 family)